MVLLILVWLLEGADGEILWTFIAFSIAQLYRESVLCDARTG